MNTIDPEHISGIIASAYTDININQNPDILSYFKHVYTENVMQKHIINCILDNAQSAGRYHIPLCQDTGTPVIFIELPPHTALPDDLSGHIRKALNDASEKNGLRMSVSEPFNEGFPADNTPVIHIIPALNEQTSVTVMAKGGGSENVSRVHIMSQSDSIENVAQYIVDSVKEASSKACPPYILGVGIGGTVEQCALASKMALAGVFRDTRKDAEKRISEMVMKMSKELHIGIQGMGFGDTLLACRVIANPSHIASMPVSVSFSCFQERVKRVVL